MALDLLSISQKAVDEIVGNSVSETLKNEVTDEFLQSLYLQADTCKSGAPYICWRDGLGEWHITQGCCNRWECPRCGQIRARQEFARMIHGSVTLSDAGHTLYFVTITCRGRSLTTADAETGYLRWTNRLLSTVRARCKKHGGYWAYVAVTERQKRKHPHSHFITTYCPEDAVEYLKGRLLPNNAIAKQSGLYSAWFVERNIAAGLGKMCSISRIDNPLGATSYLGKYLFKDALHCVWPKHWRRIRYSHSWPKLPGLGNGDAFPLVNLADWQRVQRMNVPVYAADDFVLYAAYARLITNVVPNHSYGTLPRNRKPLSTP